MKGTPVTCVGAACSATGDQDGDLTDSRIGGSHTKMQNWNAVIVRVTVREKSHPWQSCSAHKLPHNRMSTGRLSVLPHVLIARLYPTIEQ
jgi:hypothetical protein